MSLSDLMLVIVAILGTAFGAYSYMDSRHLHATPNVTNERIATIISDFSTLKEKVSTIEGDIARIKGMERFDKLREEASDSLARAQVVLSKVNIIDERYETAKTTIENLEKDARTLLEKFEELDGTTESELLTKINSINTLSPDGNSLVSREQELEKYKTHLDKQSRIFQKQLDSTTAFISQLNTFGNASIISDIRHIAPKGEASTSSKKGKWETIDNMEIDIHVRFPSSLLILYSITVTTETTNSSSWVATRLVLDGQPRLSSGRHMQPRPGEKTRKSTDGVLSAQDLVWVEPGDHTISLEWRASHGIWRNDAGTSEDKNAGGIFGRSLTVVVLSDISKVFSSNEHDNN